MCGSEQAIFIMHPKYCFSTPNNTRKYLRYTKSTYHAKTGLFHHLHRNMAGLMHLHGVFQRFQQAVTIHVKPQITVNETGCPHMREQKGRRGVGIGLLFD